MANSAQARKRARQALKRRAHNRTLRSRLRTHLKNTSKAIASGDLEAARTAFGQAVPVLDRMARKGIIHKNKAARHKQRLNARIRALANG